MNIFKKFFKPKKVEQISINNAEPAVYNDEGYEEYVVEHDDFDDLLKLFITDRAIHRTHPVYSFDGGDKKLLLLDNGNPTYLKTSLKDIALPLNNDISEIDFFNMFVLAAKNADVIDSVEEYKKNGGWASVSGNKLEDRMHVNIYIKDFPYTLLLPENQDLGVICIYRNVDMDEFNQQYGFCMVLEKVKVLRS